jgi:hypothetical protein
MEKGAIFSNLDGRVEYDSAEVVDAEPLAYAAAGRDGYPRGHLDESLTDETKRLSRYPFPVAPVEETVNQDSLESLGEETGDKCPQ